MGKRRYNFSDSYHKEEREVSDVLYVMATVLYAEVEQPVHETSGAECRPKLCRRKSIFASVRNRNPIFSVIN
jgi:hypothetical protein